MSVNPNWYMKRFAVFEFRHWQPFLSKDVCYCTNRTSTPMLFMILLQRVRFGSGIQVCQQPVQMMLRGLITFKRSP